MMLKIAIIGSILVIGGIIFSTQIQEIFPNTSSDGVNSLKSDISSLTTKSIQTVEEEVNSSVEKVENKITEIGNQTVNKAEETIKSSINETETKFSEIHQNSKEYIEKNITEKIPIINSNQ